MSLPAVCVRCRAKPCERSDPGELGICDYEIAFYNDGGTVIRAESSVPMRQICWNLRHELHHVLNVIVEQASIIDPEVSSRRINLNRPASRILAATMIIDNFIQMLTGVYEFHPPYGGEQLSLGRSLAEIVRKYFSVYSVLQGTRRAADLRLEIDFDDTLAVPYCVAVYEYLTALLMDNAWKYSVPNTPVRVSVLKTTNGFADVAFRNISRPVPKELDLFAKGSKANPNAEGFGYGLYWSTILVDYYNRQLCRTNNLLGLRHSQTLKEDGVAEQEFAIVNADLR